MQIRRTRQRDTEQGRTHKRRSPVDLNHMDAQMLNDQLEHIYNSSVRTQDVV